MAQYNKIVINKLLDTYESSLLSTGDNTRNINIEFRFSKKYMPAYYDDSSLEYDNIHILMKELEEKNLIKIIWKDKKIGHIIEKVQLRVDNVQQVYDYVKRVPKSDLEKLHIKELSDYLDCVETPVCRSFVEYLLSRIQSHKTVKEFIELDGFDETKRLLDTIQFIENNSRQLYLREFSIRVLRDSKALEQIESKIASIFRRFKAGCEDMDFSEILAEYNIYHTPNYVYLKGDATISIGDETLNLASLKQGVGISGEDISRVRFVSVEKIKKVITIENLTAFFRWSEENSLIVYLGGYHNTVRRTLLQEIYSNIPQIAYYHFGDIDAGGFEIYRDLCKKTGIPFLMYNMGVETLKEYERFGKTLTQNDRMRLEKMKEQEHLRDVVEYMLEHNMKLEQECVMCEKEQDSNKTHFLR